MTNRERYASEIYAAAERYPNVPESWIWAVIGAESSFRDIYRTWEPNVKEYAYGPMQVLVSTAADLGFSEEQLQTTEGAIAAGTALLSQLISRFGYDFERIYSAYNSGNPDKFKEGGQVAANVSRAAGWLSEFAQELETAGAAAVSETPVWLIGALVLGGLYWWSQRTDEAVAA